VGYARNSLHDDVATRCSSSAKVSIKINLFAEQERETKLGKIGDAPSKRHALPQ
jgi:hypothetical protein